MSCPLHEISPSLLLHGSSLSELVFLVRTHSVFSFVCLFFFQSEVVILPWIPSRRLGVVSRRQFPVRSFVPVRSFPFVRSRSFPFVRSRSFVPVHAAAHPRCVDPGGWRITINAIFPVYSALACHVSLILLIASRVPITSYISMIV